VNEVNGGEALIIRFSTESRLFSSMGKVKFPLAANNHAFGIHSGLM
jgi:hypothetical protein